MDQRAVGGSGENVSGLENCKNVSFMKDIFSVAIAGLLQNCLLKKK